MNAAHQTSTCLARRGFLSVIGCAATSMTAAHRLPGVLMRRCRGARAVARFSGGVESRNAPARIAPATPCRSLGVERPDAQPEPPRAQSRSSARPAEPFNAASNERSPEPGRCLVSSEAPGCRGDAYTLPSPCEMTTHCMAKANAGVGGRHGCTQHADRQPGVKTLAGLADRIERIANRAVRR